STPKNTSATEDPAARAAALLRGARHAARRPRDGEGADAARPPGGPAELPAGRAGRGPWAAPTAQPAVAGRAREARPVAREAAARRAVRDRGRAARPVRALRRGARRR